MTQKLADELAQITKKGRANNDKAYREKILAAEKTEKAMKKEARQHARELYPEIVAEIKAAAAKGDTSYRRYFGESRSYLLMLEEVARLLRAEGLQAEAVFLKASGVYGQGHHKYGWTPNDTTLIDVTWK